MVVSEREEDPMFWRAATMGYGGYGGWRGEDAVGACTESLGSESGDVGGDDTEINQLPAAEEEEEEAGGAERIGVEPLVASSPEKKRRRLPPAMPRAAEAFMRAERCGGRLILTEVRVEQRRGVFRASRAGGRLRLRFVDDDAASSPDSEKEPEARGSGGGEKVQVAVHGGFCNVAGGEFSCQVAAGKRRVEVGVVMGI
ncbi:protein SUGARY ENHANCER 1-like [Phragmites australis]|uniref:protein SUGARY ENHANCER 1-like n=1 Tax=Phragmites australis TaxID=29695 RepID=UPI002D773F2F|nr:protein SUGARY ENHANCER 1-like [Phragmites australis]